MVRKCIIVSQSDIKAANVQLGMLPEINGMLNDGVASGFLYEHDGSGVAIRTSEIGPNGYLAAHRADGTACIQVISGSGATGLTDQDGNVSSEIALKAGDLVVFEEGMPLHFYRAGAEGMSYIAVSIPARARL